jgi:hypothetical protein
MGDDVLGIWIRITAGGGKNRPSRSGRVASSRQAAKAQRAQPIRWILIQATKGRLADAGPPRPSNPRRRPAR